MCGIFGCLGTGENAAQVTLEGLKRLEHRGYDSVGIAGFNKGELRCFKRVGKISQLNTVPFALNSAIAHTRWATHGGIKEANAHPHFDEKEEIALVHNGIIENYTSLRAELKSKGITFRSETDSEIIAHLLALAPQATLLEKMVSIISRLEGSFAFAAISVNEPDCIVCATRKAPLLIGQCPHTKAFFISSDANAFAGRSLDIIYLGDDEVALIKPGLIRAFNRYGIEIVKSREHLNFSDEATEKDGFDHYLIKEIFQQKDVLEKGLQKRVDQEQGNARFEEVSLNDTQLRHIDSIVIVACGSSYHAGAIAKPLLQALTGKKVDVEIASEFRYSSPLLTPNTLVIAVSQSGETADTIAAIDLVKRHTEKIIALCNVMTSTMKRLVPNTIDLCAGPEISVCSTKALISQLLALYLLALKLGRLHGMTIKEGKIFIAHVEEMVSKVDDVFALRPQIAEIAKKAAGFSTTFFIGRQEMFPTCMEAALKLKEISYVHAFGMPAGELKHGTIALITEEALTIVLCGNEQTLEKTASNIAEIIARQGPVIAFVNEGVNWISSLVQETLVLPRLPDRFAPFLYTIATQLYAYYIAHERQCDIDHPRNLAKSVTVE